MLTMLLGGLWHGAAWGFVLWGGLHGLYLGAERILRGRFKPLPAWAGWLIVLNLVVLAWIPYRAPDISPFERPLTDSELARFATGFSAVAVRAFALPHVQVGQVLPIVKNYWRALYWADRRILDAAPLLRRYASIRVIHLKK